MKRLFAVVAGCLMLAACGHVQTSGQKLQETVQSFNESYRWGKYYTAGLYVNPKIRRSFVENAIGNNVRITEFEVREVLHDKTKGMAVIIVRYSWYGLPSISIRTTIFKQQWKYNGTAWMLMSQKMITRKKKRLSGMQQL